MRTLHAESAIRKLGLGRQEVIFQRGIFNIAVSKFILTLWAIQNPMRHEALPAGWFKLYDRCRLNFTAVAALVNPLETLHT